MRSALQHSQRNNSPCGLCPEGSPPFKAPDVEPALQWSCILSPRGLPVAKTRLALNSIVTQVKRNLGSGNHAFAKQ
jgi:hypothetical protein